MPVPQSHSGRPAYLDGYVRVFGYSSPPWAGGSVASVAPKEGGRVYGRFYLMTPQEVWNTERKTSQLKCVFIHGWMEVQLNWTETHGCDSSWTRYFSANSRWKSWTCMST